MELYGVALGQMGLRHEEFCQLSIEEFQAIYNAWQKQKEMQTQDAWERMRLLATICIQPHLKKKITAKALLQFPWDKKKTQEGAKRLTQEESEKRVEELMKRMEKGKGG